MHMLRGPMVHILESQRISWRSKDGYQLKCSISVKENLAANVIGPSAKTHGMPVGFVDELMFLGLLDILQVIWPRI